MSIEHWHLFVEWLTLWWDVLFFFSFNRFIAWFFIVHIAVQLQILPIIPDKDIEKSSEEYEQRRIRVQKVSKFDWIV